MGRPLFALFSHAAPRVSDAAALVMRAIAEGGAAAAEPMRDAALAEGAILHHLHAALGMQVCRSGCQLTHAVNQFVGEWHPAFPKSSPI